MHGLNMSLEFITYLASRVSFLISSEKKPGRVCYAVSNHHTTFMFRGLLDFYKYCMNTVKIVMEFLCIRKY